MSIDLNALTIQKLPKGSRKGIDTRLLCAPKTLLSYIEKVVAEKGRKAVLSDLLS